MKKLIYTLFFVLISVVANGQAKYVFYFIGDGMGVNQVNGKTGVSVLSHYCLHNFR